MEIKPYGDAALLMTPGEPPSLVSRLRDQFNSARFGHYFRTQTLFNTVTMGREWLYAVQDPHSRRCILMKVHESENDDEEDRLPIGENVPFIDALNQLSRFEDLSLNPRMLPTDEEEIAQLGTSHFNAFANREGLVRDQKNGDYVPTLNGHVVTKGAFHRGDLARTMCHVQNPPARTEKFIVPDHPQQQPFTSSIGQIMALYKTLGQIQQATIYHKALSQISNYTLNGGQSFDAHRICPELYSDEKSFLTQMEDEYSAILKKQDGRYSSQISKIEQFFRSGRKPYHDNRISAYVFFGVLEKLRETPFVDQAQARLHNRILNSHEAAYEFSLCRHYARAILDTAAASHHSRQDLAAKLETRLKNLNRMADKTGLDPVMKSTLLANVHGHTLPAYFEETADFIKKLDEAHKQVAHDISIHRQHLQDLAP